MERGYESAEICKVCGGACCKANGCSLAPEDMLRELAAWRAERENGETPDRGRDVRQSAATGLRDIEEWLQESDCAIDSFTGEAGLCYYIRMRHKCFTFIGVDAMGECIALTDQGCSLPYDRRPQGGRYLEGRQDRHCRQHYTREQMEADWRPYQQLLREIWDNWHDRLMQQGVFDRCEEAYMCYQMDRRRKQQGTQWWKGSKKDEKEDSMGHYDSDADGGAGGLLKYNSPPGRRI